MRDLGFTTFVTISSKQFRHLSCFLFVVFWKYKLDLKLQNFSKNRKLSSVLFCSVLNHYLTVFFCAFVINNNSFIVLPFLITHCLSIYASKIPFMGLKGTYSQPKSII